MSTSFRNARSSSGNPFRVTELGVSDTVVAPDITAYERPSAAGTAPAGSRKSATQPLRPDVPEAHTSIVEARHPDMARAITLLWGFAEMNEYFDRLWLADGSHGPIDPDAMSELMLLARLHQMIVPQRPGRSLADIYGSNRLFNASATTRDPWSDVPPRR
jgi:hypothetical protein